MTARPGNALALGLVLAFTVVSSLASGSRPTGATTVSQRLFHKMAAVIESPRCLNCHPAGRSPTQGDDMHLHTPPMVSDASGHGIPGLHCSACHSVANVPIRMPNVQSVPGDKAWALAPAAFAWQHRSLREICEQIKDPRRNGDRTLQQIHDHVADDPLVGWAWHPGLGRKPAPMTQKTFGELVARWIASGAQCPSA